MRSVKMLFLMSGIMLLFTITSCSSIQAQPAATEKQGYEIKGDLKIYRDLRYAAKPDSFENDVESDRTLDLYRPVAAKGKLPVILFIHGGGFTGGDKKGTEAVCTRLSSLGYAVVSINYRLALKGKKVEGASASANMAKGLPETGTFHPALHQAINVASEDTQLALGWIKKHAAQYKLNTSAIVLSGGSAGAMTALHTAYVSDQKILPVKAVVNLWGGLENTELIKKGAAPILTYHGDLDDIIHVDFAYAIKKQMEKTGNTKSRLQVMEGKGHARYDFIAKEKTEEIDAFLRNCFNKP